MTQMCPISTPKSAVFHGNGKLRNLKLTFYGQWTCLVTSIYHSHAHLYPNVASLVYFPSKHT